MENTMNNKLNLLLLAAPLLFTSCNSTSVTPKVEAKQEVLKNKTEELKQEIIQSNTSTIVEQDTTVLYANSNETVKRLGKLHITSFMETLKPTLMGLMKSDPTFQTAMGGCTTMATSMTNNYNDLSDTKVRRTALKYRNPNNKPDATDKTVMERFLASNDFKEPLVVEMSDHYRVYKALDIKKPCLACHGENISNDLRNMLLKSYPTDMATNFKLGEFRGVVVAKVKK
jgi:hypothetical protein